MKALCFFFSGLFLLGAAVQWNDPDPAAWIVAYLLGAALSLHAAIGGRAFGASATAAIVFAGWFASLAATIPEAPEEAFTSFQMRETSHEEPPEILRGALRTPGGPWGNQLNFQLIWLDRAVN